MKTNSIIFRSEVDVMNQKIGLEIFDFGRGINGKRYRITEEFNFNDSSVEVWALVDKSDKDRVVKMLPKYAYSFHCFELDLEDIYIRDHGDQAAISFTVPACVSLRNFEVSEIADSGNWDMLEAKSPYRWNRQQPYDYETVREGAQSALADLVQ